MEQIKGAFSIHKIIFHLLKHSWQGSLWYEPPQGIWNMIQIFKILFVPRFFRNKTLVLNKVHLFPENAFPWSCV